MKNNTKLTVWNVERDFKVLRQKLGIKSVRFSRHTLRHTSEVSYLSIFSLKNEPGGESEAIRRQASFLCVGF
jgi:hypothetical protein